MPNGALLPVAIPGAPASKKMLYCAFLFFAGLVSVLLVNNTYYREYSKSLAPEVITTWESVKTSEDFNNPSSSYLSVRLFWMDKTIASVNGGEPYTVHDHEMGFYYYGGLLGRLFGFTKGWQVFLFLQMAAASLALLVYPLLVYKITSSLACGLVSPFLFHVFFGQVLYLQKTDTYWAYAWVVVLGLPLFFLFVKRTWGIKKWLLLLLLVFVAAAGNVVRSLAGLPVFGALAVFLGREWYKTARRKKVTEAFSCVAALSLCFLVGAVFSTAIPSAFFQKYGYRNLRFPPWHTLYIGLGYGANPYRIGYVDDAGRQHAQKINPETFYTFDGPSHESYFTILKNEYFKILKENPLFFISVYARKAAGAVRANLLHLLSLRFKLFFLFALLAVFLLYRFIAQKPVRTLLGPFSAFFRAALVFAFFGIIPGLAAIPLPDYLYGSMYACSAAVFCLALSAVKGFAAVSAVVYSRVRALEENSFRSAGEETETRPAPLLAIVVPCFNEEEVLPESARLLSDKIKQLAAADIVSAKSALFFVDDGSTDKTWNLVKQYHAENPSLVRGIRLAANRGQQNALLAGLMEANNFADAVITIDADLQDDINAIDAMLAKYRLGAEIVYGVRAGRKSDSAFKRITAQAFYRLTRFLGAEIVYNHADFRLMAKNALEALAEYGEANVFLRGIIPMLGCKTDAVYYDRKERRAGTGKYPPGKMLEFAIDGISSLSVKPLRLISVLGAAIFAVSLGMILYFFVRYYSGNTVTGWASIACSIWGTGGLILLSVGIVGEYIGKIYLEAKRRPRYRVEQRL